MKCWVCGKENATVTRNFTIGFEVFGNIMSRRPAKAENQRCYCQDCYTAHVNKLKEENELYVSIKRRRLYENALVKLEKQGFNFVKHEEAIKAVGAYNEENDGKFDSSNEIMAAIVLIHNHYKIRPQFKVERYQIDFLLPDQNVALEIDGDRHKNRKGYDSVRDEKIVRELEAEFGGKWHVIRIDAELIDQNAAKLPEAIEKALDYRDTHKVHWRDL